MREALKNAVQSAILFECQLPHQESGLGKSCLSSQNDICFNNTDPQEIAKVIYNGIVEFALNEYEINYDDLEREQRRAILSRIRYNPTADNSAKLKYLEGGFMSMVDYYTTRRNPPKTKDEAIRTVADFVYNVFKYHLVKYLGLFDVFFRYRVSVLENVDMDSVPGLGLLMQKLEYNALSPTARKVSDYGVPFKLIDCYDSQAEYDKEQFDAYEKRVDEQVSRLFQ